MASNLLSQFRLIALVEGISYLFLIFIAMPMKYFMGMPLVVKYTGWAHGILFIAYFVWLFLVYFKYHWPFSKLFWATVASLIPFGTFVLDAKILKPSQEE